MIAFNVPFQNGFELESIEDALQRGEFSGNGYYTKHCELFLEQLTETHKCLLTSSCSHALDMCAILIDIKPGDEVIMSAFNFVSAANAFVSRGAIIRFVDIDPLSMNIDPDLIEQAINDNTKAVLVMHYGGVACEMNTIKKITQKHNLFLIEDAAHCIDSYYKKQHLGSIGDLGTISFHSTKNIHCGEGGALLINNKSLVDRAEIIREKGTNRTAFINGKVDKYSWVDIGSSYLMSEISAAFLFSQLKSIQDVRTKRTALFNKYHSELSKYFSLCYTSPNLNESNKHLFFLKVKEQSSVLAELRQQKIQAVFHYIPLHNSIAGKKYAIFNGTDNFTTIEAKKLIRLPLYYNLEDQDYILKTLIDIVKK